MSYPKYINIVASTALIAAGLLQACGTKHSSESDSQQLQKIDVAEAETDSVVIHKEYPGYLSADRAIDIVARVNGVVKSKTFTDGQAVKQGQVLFYIEDSQYADAVTQAQAALETARATNVYATNQYNAMKKALESDAVSKMDVIQAESSMNESAASIKNAEAALRTARTNLGYCTIRAAADGHVAAPTVSEGTYVSGAASPYVLTTLYDDDYCSAVISIDETEYIKIKDENFRHKIDYSNIPLQFSEALPHTYTGKLDYVAPDVDSSTGTVTVKVKVMNPYGELKQGMYVVVKMPVETNPKALLVKDSSIATDQLGKYLYVVNDSNKVVYTPIVVGDLVRDSMRVVQSGLQPGDKYVTRALLKVRDGMTVDPVLGK